VVVGSREMRTMGNESAYGVHESQLDRPTGAIDAEELAETAGRVARSWSW
jgi:glycerate kinase